MYIEDQNQASKINSVPRQDTTQLKEDWYHLNKEVATIFLLVEEISNI